MSQEGKLFTGALRNQGNFISLCVLFPYYYHSYFPHSICQWNSVLWCFMSQNFFQSFAYVITSTQNSLFSPVGPNPPKDFDTPSNTTCLMEYGTFPNYMLSLSSLNYHLTLWFLFMAFNHVLACITAIQISAIFPDKLYIHLKQGL